MTFRRNLKLWTPTSGLRGLPNLPNAPSVVRGNRSSIRPTDPERSFDGPTFDRRQRRRQFSRFCFLPALALGFSFFLTVYTYGMIHVCVVHPLR